MTAPYRVPAPAEGDQAPAPRYVPLTSRQDRLRRVLRSVPIAMFAAAALLLERPWLFAVAFVWGAGVVILGRLHARSLNERLKALARTLAKDGDPWVAARGLESIIADARPYPGFHCVALLFLGIARARGGDADGGLELLHVVRSSGWLAHRPVWLAWLLPWVSQLHAARGELDLAERWLEVARAQLPADKQDVLVSPAMLVALRRGRNDEAIAAIEAYVGGAEASDPVREHFALLRAFARARAGQPVDQAEVRRLVKSRLASPGRALPLEKWWDEFAAFVDQHA